MSLVAAADEDLALGKIMDLQQQAFLLTLPDALVSSTAKREILTTIASAIDEHTMMNFYTSTIQKLANAVESNGETAKKATTAAVANSIDLAALTKEPTPNGFGANLLKGCQPSSTYITELKSSFEKKEKDLKLALEDAVANYGEVEVWDAVQNQIDFLARTSTLDVTVKTIDEALKTHKASTNQKIRSLFKRVRSAIFHSDITVLTESLEQTNDLIEKGGDWEKRNRFSVLKAIAHMMKRELTEASTLLLGTVKTFTSYDVISYDTFCQYTCILGMLSLPRAKIKADLLDCPDLIPTLNAFPALKKYVYAFYEGRYKDFFLALLEISDFLAKDRFLAPHRNYIIKEMRAKVYNQYLAAYKSVRLASMAKSFGVSTNFIDNELCLFIAGSRVNAKIDRVNGIVETSRPAGKNGDYQQVIEKGDILLNNIQKLTRIIQS